MRILGVLLSGSGLPFVSAEAVHRAGRITGTVACETQEQCDAVAVWAAREGLDITMRVATAEEVATMKYWSERG